MWSSFLLCLQKWKDMWYLSPPCILSFWPLSAGVILETCLLSCQAPCPSLAPCYEPPLAGRFAGFSTGEPCSNNLSYILKRIILKVHVFRLILSDLYLWRRAGIYPKETGNLFDGRGCREISSSSTENRLSVDFYFILFPDYNDHNRKVFQQDEEPVSLFNSLADLSPTFALNSARQNKSQPK